MRWCKITEMFNIYFLYKYISQLINVLINVLPGDDRESDKELNEI